MEVLERSFLSFSLNEFGCIEPSSARPAGLLALVEADCSARARDESAVLLLLLMELNLVDGVHGAPPTSGHDEVPISGVQIGALRPEGVHFGVHAHGLQLLRGRLADVDRDGAIGGRRAAPLLAHRLDDGRRVAHLIELLLLRVRLVLPLGSGRRHSCGSIRTLVLVARGGG
jgi:hypothetical protein